MQQFRKIRRNDTHSNIGKLLMTYEWSKNKWEPKQALEKKKCKNNITYFDVYQPIELVDLVSLAFGKST